MFIFTFKICAITFLSTLPSFHRCLYLSRSLVWESSIIDKKRYFVINEAAKFGYMLFIALSVCGCVSFAGLAFAVYTEYGFSKGKYRHLHLQFKLIDAFFCTEKCENLPTTGVGRWILMATDQLCVGYESYDQ